MVSQDHDTKVKDREVRDAVLSATSISTDTDFDVSSDKRAFLKTFSPEEDRAIMRKVDKRFLLLIGLIYLIKNVSNSCISLDRN